MSDDTDSADRPAGKESEIEVTPEMIAAGSNVIWNLVGDLIPVVGGEAPWIAKDVYLAMESLRLERQKHQ